MICTEVARAEIVLEYIEPGSENVSQHSVADNASNSLTWTYVSSSCDVSSRTTLGTQGHAFADAQRAASDVTEHSRRCLTETQT